MSVSIRQHDIEQRINAVDKEPIRPAKIDAAISDIRKYDDVTIFSLGGFHRWYVYPNGNVVFSHRHSVGDEYTLRAIEQGFDISGLLNGVSS